jgi:phage baseplate assembly protein W
MASGLTLKLPVAIDDADGLKLLKNFPELVEQNLKNLMLTVPGERIMDPAFGVGLPNYLFEQNDPTTYAEIQAKIQQQVTKYLPFVQINSIKFTSSTFSSDGVLPVSGPAADPNYVGLSITYTIIPIKTTKTMNL